MSQDICAPVSPRRPLSPRRPEHPLPAPLFPTRPLLAHILHTDTGDRPYKCQHCGDQFARRSVYPLLIRPLFFPRATPMRNLSSPLPPHVARAPLPPAERQHRSRHAISASSPLCHVTVPIHAVSLLNYLVPLTHNHPHAYPCVASQVRAKKNEMHLRQISPPDRASGTGPPSPSYP